MKALIIGYGSIGMRHARILSSLGCDVGVFSRRSIDFPLVFNGLDAALKLHNPGYIVIANTTAEHQFTLQQLVNLGYAGYVLVEKPIFATVCEMPKHNFAGIWVGYNLRFHPIVQYLKKWLKEESAISAHAYVGQYLPEWRPSTDYRKSYSADTTQGGGVLRDLSHELDYLGMLLGGWERVASIGGHFSTLEINSDDHYAILMQSKRCHVIALQVSYLDRVPQRNITINAKNSTIIADFSKGIINDNGQIVNFTCERDSTYLDMHKAILRGSFEDLCTVEHAQDVMSLIAASERASMNKTWISR
jgi:predicted dehydrogenase